MKQIFAVIKRGVYMQGIFGIFEDDREALDYALKLIMAERDDYHTFELIQFTLDEQSEGKKVHIIQRKNKYLLVDGKVCQLET